MIKVGFYDRLKIEKLFDEWCVKNQTTRSVQRFTAFLEQRGWLNSDKVVTDLKKVELD